MTPTAAKNFLLWLGLAGWSVGWGLVAMPYGLIAFGGVVLLVGFMSGGRK